MTDFNDEENLGKMLKSAYRPVSPPPELKRQLLERLVLEANVATAGTASSIWGRPRIWIPIAAAIVAGVIGYGAWLSMNISATMLP